MDESSEDASRALGAVIHGRPIKAKTQALSPDSENTGMIGNSNSAIWAIS
jgi:hypothetical protein